MQISLISSILAGTPYKCTTTTALGFGYLSKAFSKALGSIFQVSFSLSINTGFAFSYIIGFTVAEKVKSDTKTISSFLIPAAFKAI